MFAGSPASPHQWWNRQTRQKNARLCARTLAAVRSTSNCPICRCTAANTQVKWQDARKSRTVLGLSSIKWVCFFFVNYYIYYCRREAVPVWRHRMWSQILSLRPAKEAPASTHRYESLSRPEPGKLETILELLTAVTVIYRAHTQLCRAAWLAVLGEPLSAGMVSSTPAEDKAVTDQRWMDESAVSVNLAPSLSSLLCKWISSSLLRERKKNALFVQ